LSKSRRKICNFCRLGWADRRYFKFCWLEGMWMEVQISSIDPHAAEESHDTYASCPSQPSAPCGSDLPRPPVVLLPIRLPVSCSLTSHLPIQPPVRPAGLTPQPHARFWTSSATPAPAPFVPMLAPPTFHAPMPAWFIGTPASPVITP
jgi:hypothetical protein